MDKGRGETATHFDQLVQNGALVRFLHHGERAILGAQFKALRNRPKLGVALDELAGRMHVSTQRMTRRQLTLAAVQEIIVDFEDGKLEGITLNWLQDLARALGAVYGSTLTDASTLSDTERYKRVTRQ